MHNHILKLASTRRKEWFALRAVFNVILLHLKREFAVETLWSL